MGAVRRRRIEFQAKLFLRAAPFQDLEGVAVRARHVAPALRALFPLPKDATDRLDGRRRDVELLVGADLLEADEPGPRHAERVALAGHGKRELVKIVAK